MNEILYSKTSLERLPLMQGGLSIKVKVAWKMYLDGRQFEDRELAFPDMVIFPNWVFSDRFGYVIVLS